MKPSSGQADDVSTTMMLAEQGQPFVASRTIRSQGGSLSSLDLPRLAINWGALTSPGGGQPGDDVVVSKVLGEGGMGQVLQGRQRSLERDVALKILKPNCATPEQMAALVTEGRISGSLEHPNIIPIHALGVDASGRPAILMKRVDGVSFGQMLAEPGHEGWSWLRRATGESDQLRGCLGVLLQVIAALDFAHARGVVHRDIKPANIMIGAFGEVYLVDWGIALAPGARAEGVVGTPAFMAPEMLSPLAGEIGPRTDVYLLGATLHSILTGRRRHEGASQVEVFRSVERSEPFAYAPEVPAELADLCNAATARDPGQRLASVQEFRKALLAFLRHEAATRLTDAALASLDALRARAILSGASTDATLPSLAIECRVGFTLALREWPENPAALAGHESCLAAVASLELDRGHLTEARGVLAEMRSPPPALQQRLADLERSSREQAARAEELRRLAREQDLRPATGLRIVLLGTLALWVLLFGARLLWSQSLGRLSMGELVVGNVFSLLAIGAVAFVTRRRLLVNAANRRLLALVVLCFSLSLGNRSLAMMRGFPLSDTLLTDQLMTAGVLLSAGLGADRHLLLAGVVMALGGVVIAFFPAQSLLVLTVAVLIALLTVVATSAAIRARAPVA